jgi:5'-nucleotidase
MTTGRDELHAVAEGRDSTLLCAAETSSRRAFLVGATAIGAAILASPGVVAAAGKTTFTILHTNDMHSAYLGQGPSSDFEHDT